MVPSLSFTLQAQSTYIQGTPFVIGFEIENLSSAEVWILKWYTPLEGIKGKIFEVRCDDVEIPFEGRMMKRGNPERDDYVHIPAGGSARAEFDLSKYYSLPECRECRLKFKGRIYDVVFDERQISRPANEHRAIEVPGEAVSFRISRS
jgi:peptidyl-Lys metalloendopeptidase